MAEGLVELRERSGIYVAPGHPGGPMLSQLSGWVVDVLLEARSREIPPITFPERVRRCLETLRLRAACIAGNEDQLEQICRELQEDYGLLSEGVIAHRLTDRDGEAERIIAQADLLVCTAAHAADTQRVAHRLGKEAITMGRAHERLGDTPLTRRVVPVRRVFSDDMGRELLGFIVRANMTAMGARASWAENRCPCAPHGPPRHSSTACSAVFRTRHRR